MLTTGVLLGSVVALPVVTAAPAHANTTQCLNYLHLQKYKIGPKSKAACKKATKSKTARAEAVYDLRSLGVRRGHAETAGDYAFWGRDRH
ncbi:hypothetical protein [Streptomyces sp. HNM0574]|uniref:hypothetical protein n=1 Tax=Streptomyces sp. HNM0574 TaxID=2714954 RepID=UPI001469E571|nr:hypothetical protein [Streptomyces sp. HNM0574]NLU68230.1 hypothetical protein [Streptomyces sp. HNM0574]